MSASRGLHALITLGRRKALEYIISRNTLQFWHTKNERRFCSNPASHEAGSDAQPLKDHRDLGKAQDLFFFHPTSPGSCFFLPHGTRIYNKLIDFLRAEYRARGYHEVITPNIYKQELWKKSGHWQNFRENMFSFQCEDHTYSLKPMNCPGHCLIFGHRPRHANELPLRLADFGVLHRNELSGALTGLTRVRRFQQDDAHIFCTPEQLTAEMKGCLEFMQRVYAIFGFDFRLEFSTRPERYMGDLALWERAEAAVRNVLDDFGYPWHLNPGDGAFYGPKIDIHVRDAHGRSYQCSTIQLDFQLPIRFDLEYVVDEHGTRQHPVIVHRAILGSVERMIAMLLEHTAGKWPFWLSPRQCAVVTVPGAAVEDYARSVAERLKGETKGYYVDLDVTDKTLPKKIREAQLAQYNYIVVVGEKEKRTETVNLRTRDNVVHGQKKVQELLDMFKKDEREFK